MASLNLPPFRNPPLNAHYEGVYDDDMIRWRHVCAIDKATNLLSILGDRRASITSVLEAGCGTGAVLLEVAKRQIGASHTGCDMADPTRHPHPGVMEAGIELQDQGGEQLPFDDKSFDLVYASHVLEHVADERGFLNELKRVSRRWIYVEVPCELHMRTTASALQSTLNIGHINSYTPESLALTLATADIDVLDVQAFDHSMEVHSFHSGRIKAIAKAITRRSLLRVNPSIASRVFTYHVGALCDVGSKS